MTDPEDGWGDLARELGLDPLPRQNPSPPPDPQASAARESDEDEADAEPPFPNDDGQQDLFQDYEPEVDLGGSESGSDSDDGTEDGTEADVGSGEGTGEPGEDGQKRKRRRRRRRKKKGGEPGETAAVGAVAVGDGEEETEEVDASGDDDQADGNVDDGSPSAEASRELIANWDVPSWEQIVAGLYRPGGR